ncbi:MAG: hypothetical protein WAP57_05095 [Aquabacterium commune]
MTSRPPIVWSIAGLDTAGGAGLSAGREGFLAGLMPTSDVAVATTPVGGQPFVLL